jgi:hypothetical protein
MTVSVHQYAPEHKSAWDAFIADSRNGSFLFMRDYMDYMSDRVADCSLIVRDRDEAIVAVLPGYLEDANTYRTHGRLTYGGLVTARSARMSTVLAALDGCLTWLADSGVTSVYYKPVPHIYHLVPAEEDLYALFLLRAAWVSTGMLSVVSRIEPLGYQERRKRAIRKAKTNGLIVHRSNDFAQYWEVLSDLLRERFQTRPVHSLAEIQQLSSSFPDNIQLYGCFRGDCMVAGVVAYISERVVRAQYIASSAEGRKLGAVDLILDHLIEEEFRNKDYIDLGTSSENYGESLNGGLIDQKEGFGARSVALNQYRIDLDNWSRGSLTSALR